jgi:hypothetical protein
MIKSALGKVMWLGRATVFVVGLAVILALVVGVASTALGANGGNFILGSLNNSATAITKLTGTVGGNPALRVSNPSTATGSTALDLQVATGKAPMKVNRTTKVTNLNADAVDGRDGSTLLANNQVRADGTQTSSFIQDFTAANFTSIASKTISAPSNGFVMITGSVSAEEDCSLSGIGNLFYGLSVDGTPVTADPGPYELSYPVQCVTATEINVGDSGAATAVVAVNAGSHTISLNAAEQGTGSFIYGRSVTSIFVPTGSADALPTVTASKEAPASQNRN